MSIHQALWVGANGEPTDIFVSYLYPIITTESIDIAHALQSAQAYTWLPGEINLTHAVLNSTLSQPLSAYNNWPIEKIDIGQHAILGGTLFQVLLTYSNWPVENIDFVHAISSGVLTTVLFSYLNWPIEGIDFTHAATNGTLT